MHVDAFSLTPKQQRMFIPSKIIPSEIQRDLNVQTRDEKSKPKTFGQVLLDRSDTLRSAGFYDVNINEESGATSSNNQYPPLTAGARTNITLFLVALGYKYYRSIFINKLAIWERQPQWNTVITSKEDEEKANLEAMTCNACGSTIFIAKGRKWFQMPKGYTCYCCGASGEEAFTNTRADLLEEVDDDYFDYEKPLDFVTAAERKKLMKQAGGDEAKANDLLTKGDGDGAQEGGDASTDAGADGDGEAPPKKKKKKKKQNKKKKTNKQDDGEVKSDASGSGDDAAKSTKSESSGEDDLDVLGMD